MLVMYTPKVWSRGTVPDAFRKTPKFQMDVMVHTCNPSYSGGRGRRTEV
jgi:hypothetical protein